MKPEKYPRIDVKPPSGRRIAERFDTAMGVLIRFLPDGTPIKGSCLDIGPNGMRLLTPIPLGEATYVHVSFEAASNNTHCEGRIVWTQATKDGKGFESGFDIQRWGGGVPGKEVLKEIPLKRKSDRRNKPR